VRELVERFPSTERGLRVAEAHDLVRSDVP
jgi:hypothetical protein